MRVHLPNDTIQNTKTGEKKDVVVSTNSVVSTKDALFGCGLIAAGVWYLLDKAFRNGCKEYNEAEFNTLNDLGLIN